jgi:hypothetical protein
MSIFNLYLHLGFDHITNLNGYDHILFIVTLCGVYILSQWKNVIVLVTAFTIGHSITLALATLRIITIPSNIIEFLIPVTIFITLVANIVYKKTEYSRALHSFNYRTAMFFGLIHGLGFSNYLLSLLGKEESIAKPFFAFNVGLEIGQLVIVMSILTLAYLFIKYLHVIRREWNLVISGAGAGVSLILMIERFPG